MNVIADRIVRKNPFLRDWSNYGIVDIFNPVATAQYQHSVTIASKPGMMHDFRDLRFFQPDGIEIPFWIESKTDGSTSFVWFKPYSLSQRKAYVFYGNREAVSQSNGEKTFDFFDDFLGSALDTTKWTASGTGSNSVSNSILQVSASGSSYFVTSNTTFGPNTAIRTLAKDTSFDNDAYGGFGYQGSTQYFNIQLPYMNWGAMRGYWASYKTAGTGAVDLALSDIANYYPYDLIRNGSTSLIINCNGVNKVTYTGAQIPDAALNIMFYAFTSGKVIYSNWILVRKYTATEPVCQFNTFGLKV